MMEKHLAEVQRGHKMFQERQEELKQEEIKYRNYLTYSLPPGRKEEET